MSGAVAEPAPRIGGRPPQRSRDGLGGEPFSPRLRVALHQIVANQLLAHNPPQTWQTVQRLGALGYDWHNIVHMIPAVVSDNLYHAMKKHRQFDPGDYARRLEELPRGRHRRHSGRSDRSPRTILRAPLRPATLATTLPTTTARMRASPVPVPASGAREEDHRDGVCGVGADYPPGTVISKALSHFRW